MHATWLLRDQRSAVAAEIADLKLGDNRGAHRPEKGSANRPTLNKDGKTQAEAWTFPEPF
jgi:hypothetical protein